jgi:hypothetical protein
MKIRDFRKLELGAYKIYWKSGGSSIATIGMTWDGGRWIAPSNWIQPVSWEKDVADTIRKISSVTLIETSNDAWGGIVSDISLELEEVCPDCGTADWAYGDLAKSKEVCALCSREREYKK